MSLNNVLLNGHSLKVCPNIISEAQMQHKTYQSVFALCCLVNLTLYCVFPTSKFSGRQQSDHDLNKKK